MEKKETEQQNLTTEIFHEIKIRCLIAIVVSFLFGVAAATIIGKQTEGR